jgi:hypothetical protein
MRVNARLDSESERQLEYLLEATGSNVSDVLKACLAHYYNVVQASQTPRLKHLLAFSEKRGSGRSDVSVRAKELLTDAISSKAPPRRTARARATR